MGVSALPGNGFLRRPSSLPHGPSPAVKTRNSNYEPGFQSRSTGDALDSYLLGFLTAQPP